MGPFSQRAEVSLPVAREETAAAATSDTLMVAGGFDTAGRDRAEVFLLTGGAWRAGPQLPLPLDHPSAAALGGILYVAGGFSAGVAQGAVESLAPASARWTPLPPLAHPRGALSLLALAGRLYAVGGKLGNGVEVAAVESWAPGEPVWTQSAPLPAPRDHVAGFVIGDRLCIAGGRSPTTARVDCLSATGSWSSATALPTATSGAAGGTVGTTAIVAGGEDAAETRLTGQVDTLTGAMWTPAPMLDPRHGVEGALFADRVWLCGGGTAPGLHATATCTSIG
jgi:non-specific serine/threonine protein kinase